MAGFSRKTANMSAGITAMLSNSKNMLPNVCCAPPTKIAKQNVGKSPNVEHMLSSLRWRAPLAVLLRRLRQGAEARGEHVGQHDLRKELPSTETAAQRSARSNRKVCRCTRRRSKFSHKGSMSASTGFSVYALSKPRTLSRRRPAGTEVSVLCRKSRILALEQKSMH